MDSTCELLRAFLEPFLQPRKIALLRRLIRVVYMAHEWSHALEGAKFGQRSKSWCRTISRRLAGAVKCVAMTSYNSWPLWSRALFIGAARHLQTCVCMRSPTLNEFGPKMLRSRKRFPNCASCLAICARKIFHPYFNGRILIVHFSRPFKCIGMRTSGCHPAIRTCGAARFCFNQCFSLAKHMLACYRLWFWC